MNRPDYYEFHAPTRLLSGRDALANLGGEFTRLGASRPLVVSDSVIAGLGLLDRVAKALRGTGVAPAGVFDAVPADPPSDVVDAIAARYEETGADSFLAVGGGSVLDSAKGAAMIAASRQDGATGLADVRGFDIIRRRLPPMVAVPTTAGTGSEATLVAVISDPQRDVKMEFISPHLIYDAAVLDPVMTRSLPPKGTAATGMDALTHAVEAFSGRQANPVSRSYAATAIRLVSAHIRRAVADGGDQEARMALADASFLAGAAFSNSMVGAVHALGHSVGALCHVPHGVAMAVLLPHVMRFNLPSVEADYAELLLPLAGPEVYAGTPESDRARAAIASIEALQADLETAAGLPRRLRDCGIDEPDYGRIASKALNDGAVITNPKPLGLEDARRILKESW